MDTIAAKEVPEVVSTVNDMTNKVNEVSKHIDALRRHVADEHYSAEKGISLLEIKYHLLLSYLIDMAQLMLHKSSGKSIADIESRNRMIEIRIVLEKIRPLDHKLKYQIDKLIKTAITGGSSNDPLQFKPNPSNLVAKLEDGSDEEGDDNAKIYVPPRIQPVHIVDDSTHTERKRQREEKLKKRLMKSSLVQELREEFSDRPLEIKDFGSRARKQREEEAEVIKYEEEYLTRTSRKRKKISGRDFQNDINEITDFSDLRTMSSYHKGDHGKGKRKRSFRKKGKGRKKMKKHR